MARITSKRDEPRPRPSDKPAPVRPSLPTNEDPPSNIGKKIVYAGLGAVALAVVVVLGITLAGEEERSVDDEALLLPNVTVTGNSLPPHDNTATDPAVGLPAPSVSSFDFAGLPATIEADGVPKVIIFLAHWCSHCQREVPVVQAWIDENGIPPGVDVVSIATSISEIRANYPPDVWLEREGWTPRVVVDDAANRISNAFGLSAFPYYVLVDGSGTVVRRISGGVAPEIFGVMLQSLASDRWGRISPVGLDA